MDMPSEDASTTQRRDGCHRSARRLARLSAGLDARQISEAIHDTRIPNVLTRFLQLLRAEIDASSLSAIRLDDGGRRLCIEKPKLSNRPRSCGRRHAGVRESCPGAGKRPKGCRRSGSYRPSLGWESNPAGLGISSPLRPAEGMKSQSSPADVLRLRIEVPRRVALGQLQECPGAMDHPGSAYRLQRKPLMLREVCLPKRDLRLPRRRSRGAC